MLQIDYKSGISICDQVVNGFIRLIALGVLSAGEALPSVRSMALKLSVNPNTVQKAYAVLEERGVIYTVKGKGSFVADSSGKLAGLKESTMKDLKKDMTNAHNLGVAYKDVIDLADDIYNGGGSSDA